MTKRFLIPLLLAALFATTGVLPSNTLFAQSDLADEDRATILFDLRLGKMREGKFMKSIEAEMESLQGGMVEQTGFDPNSLVRVFGAACLPNNMAEFDEPDPPESLQFFVRLEMTDADSANGFTEMMKSGDAEEVEVNGESFLSLNDGILCHIVDGNTVEIGTSKYLTQSTRRLFTAGLNEAFKKTPDYGIRVVADLKAENALISEAVEAAKAEADQMMGPMLDLADNASDIALVVDFDAKNLLSVIATGNSESEADELRGGLDGLLGMAKMFGGPATTEIPNPEVAKMAKEVVDSLKATRDGTTVRIDIPRPSNFDEAVGAAMEMIPQMMMGGF